jgi:hypothetical protein
MHRVLAHLDNEAFLVKLSATRNTGVSRPVARARRMV